MAAAPYEEQDETRWRLAPKEGTGGSKMAACTLRVTRSSRKQDGGLHYKKAQEEARWRLEPYEKQ
jgi:hypothetical protein